MSLVDVSRPVSREERLGRAWFSRKKSPSDFKRALRDAYKKHGEISVDRLDIADLLSLRDLHDQEAVSNVEVENFYGWQCFRAERAMDSAHIKVTPVMPTNPWHADVVPFDDGDHLVELCTAAAGGREWLAKEKVS